MCMAEDESRTEHSNNCCEVHLGHSCAVHGIDAASQIHSVGYQVGIALQAEVVVLDWQESMGTEVGRHGLPDQMRQRMAKTCMWCMLAAGWDSYKLARDSIAIANSFTTSPASTSLMSVHSCSMQMLHQPMSTSFGTVCTQLLHALETPARILL